MVIQRQAASVSSCKIHVISNKEQNLQQGVQTQL